MDDRKAREIDLHHRLAEEYRLRYEAPFARNFQNYWNEKLLSLMPQEAERILDCGCGIGILLSELKKKYDEPCGIDLSLDMLRLVPSELNKKVGSVIAGDAECLPYKKEGFDAIICRGVVHHLPDRERGISEIKRILRRDGALVLSEPCNDALFIKWARFLLYKFSKKFDEEDKGFNSNELKALLEETGFRLERVERFGYFAYALAGFPDILPVLKFVPFNSKIVKLLVVLDEILAKIPFLSNFGFHVIMVAKKGREN